MDHNPYAPPAAKVVDAEPVPVPLVSRPWQLKTSVTLMCLSLAVWYVPNLAYLDVIEFVIVGSILALVIFVARGHRWARIVYAAVASWGVFIGIRNLVAGMELPPLDRTLYLSSVAFDVVATVLLFVPASNAWFRARSIRS